MIYFFLSCISINARVLPEQKMKNYFGLGVGFGILRTLIGDVTVLAPKNLHRLFKMRILKVGIFGASYVVVYEVNIRKYGLRKNPKPGFVKYNNACFIDS